MFFTWIAVYIPILIPPFTPYVQFENTQNYESSSSFFRENPMEEPRRTRYSGERAPPGGGRGCQRGRGRGCGRGRGRGHGHGSVNYHAECSDHQPAQPTIMENRVTAVPNAKPVPIKLNPNAKEYYPLPESDRSLFLTFSYGRPIPEMEIAKFFNSTYWECVERVYVHWPAPWNKNQIPLFGKIVFKEASIPLMMTAFGTKQCMFNIDGNPLWCKKFELNKTRSPKWNNK
ncbi:PREDICTED: uncharacterized protein LOC18614422 [Theobroma cacao]|uniref:Uncharacterized protein LOC18614422 n=1 Tax=Theobroma cacao TaxID=3641 RepID=A0AB32WFH1_THECC|nr:PREDICTED: uncharacterized protein LOC18614422 [Theobroma cacao]